jgi:hypothetical protein
VPGYRLAPTEFGTWLARFVAATMIESNSVEVGSGDLTRTFVNLRPAATTIECSRTVALALLVSAAVVIRTFALGASGFSEDEINKLRAIRAYSAGNFSANAEIRCS